MKPKVSPLDEIKRIEQKREQRRIKMEDMKRQKQQKKAYNMASGKNVDIDFEIMIDKNRFKDKMLSQHTSSAQSKLSVCVRKRPIFHKEEVNGEIDSISAANPQIKIHEPKYKVDGITKYVENHTFTFDNTFHQAQTTADIYNCSMKPLMPMLLNQGVVTCFAYGQTGSGKTYTMNQMQTYLVEQLFALTKGQCQVAVNFFQIYAGRCLDLLNQKNVLNIMEDKSNNIQIQGIVDKTATNPKELLQIMDQANKARTTHSTAANDTSSRSHSICQVIIKKGGKQIGKLVLVDLAGSQRAQDTQSNNRQRRMQGAQINKSLLALKECIRAMGDKAEHVPFRASKLTLILRDSFIAKHNESKVIMIACISPGSSSADHSLNTLRYADRLKDNSQIHKMYNDMVEKRQEESTDVQNQLSKDYLKKIQSLKNLKQDKEKPPPPAKIIPDKKAPPLPNNSALNSKKKQEAKPESVKPQPPKQQPPKQQQPKQEAVKQQIKAIQKGRSGSTNKQVSAPTSNKSVPVSKQAPKKQQSAKRTLSEKQNGNRAHNEKQNGKQGDKGNRRQSDFDEDFIEQQIEEEIQVRKDKVDKKKIKEDVNIMKSTFKNNNMGEQYFAFQEKVSNIYEEQEEVFATHMAAIKEDAKLLTQESELISKVQGVGYVDFDIDSYVEKLQNVVKKKLKMYNLLSKKIQHFKDCLKEQEEVRHNIKGPLFY